MLRSFWRLSQDPNRLGEVFAIADRGSKPEILAETARFVARDPQGARALGEGLRLGPVDLVALKKLPEGTLGRVFADHMIENGLDPRAIPVSTYPPGDFRYVKTHLREIHDIWHVVTGFDTDVAGEIGLQAFYLAQLPSRLSAVLIAMAFVHMATKNIEARDPIMNAVLRGWAIGKQARPFFGVEWAKHWGTPLAEVRALLDVDVALHEAKIPEQQPYVYRARRVTAFFVAPPPVALRPLQLLLRPPLLKAGPNPFTDNRVRRCPGRRRRSSWRRPRHDRAMHA